MKSKLVRMAEETAKAAQHEEVADTDWTLAKHQEELATTNKANGQVLQQNANVLLESGNKDKATAVVEQDLADQEAAKAAGEEGRAMTHFAKAESLQVTVDVERLQALADSTVAVRSEWAARADEVGTGLCEFIPLLDVICDIVGGTAAVGLETTAATEEAASAAIIASIVEAQATQDTETTLAVELEGEATRDGDLATEGHDAASELEAKAEEEIAEAQHEETAAKEEMEESVLEEEAAEVEEGEAAEEEAQSESSLTRSAEYGVAACRDAFLATVASSAAVIFFATRFTCMIVSSFATIHMPNIDSSNGAFSYMTLKHLCRASIHCITFGIALGWFGSRYFLYFDSLSVRARGGLVLLFALDVALVQGLVVHALPTLWMRAEKQMPNRIKVCSLELLGRVAYLFPLITMDFLILRITFGQAMFSSESLDRLRQWYMMAIFVASLLTYYVCFERPITTMEEEEVLAGSASRSFEYSWKESYGSIAMDKSELAAVESDSLPLSLDPKPATEQQQTRTTFACSNHLAALHKFFAQYQIPFDLLIAACGFAVLRSCLLKLKNLWPLVRATMRVSTTAHSKTWCWIIIDVTVCGTFTLMGIVAFCLYRKRKTCPQ